MRKDADANSLRFSLEKIFKISPQNFMLDFYVESIHFMLLLFVCFLEGIFPI